MDSAAGSFPPARSWCAVSASNCRSTSINRNTLMLCLHRLLYVSNRSRAEPDPRSCERSALISYGVSSLRAPRCCCTVRASRAEELPERLPRLLLRLLPVAHRHAHQLLIDLSPHGFGIGRRTIALTVAVTRTPLTPRRIDELDQEVVLLVRHLYRQLPARPLLLHFRLVDHRALLPARFGQPTVYDSRRPVPPLCRSRCGIVSSDAAGAWPDMPSRGGERESSLSNASRPPIRHHVAEAVPSW